MSTVLTDKLVVTRKPHQCWGCSHSYEKGSKMRYNTYADQGSVHSAYWCETCDYIVRNHYDHWDLQNGVEFGSVKDNDVGFWHSTKWWDIERKPKQETE